jgi:hypothetical protein
MKVRRLTAALALGAVLLAQAPATQAARMLCPMKKPARTEACSRCDADRTIDRNGSYRATTCCRIAPVPSTEATPLVLSARAPSSSADPLALVGPSLRSSLQGLDADPSASTISPPRSPDPERLSRLTVLRN